MIKTFLIGFIGGLCAIICALILYIIPWAGIAVYWEYILVGGIFGAMGGVIGGLAAPPKY